jgi:Flp pilus assembly protein TadB
VSRRTPDAAQSITSAPEPLAADQARRERRYLIQMGIRIVCFLLAVLLWQYVPMWVSLVLIVGAVVLPYTAVLFANAGRERRDVAPVPVLPPMLDAGPRATPADPVADPGDHRPDDDAPRADPAGGPR